MRVTRRYVLFFSSPSPGQAFRFLERHLREDQPQRTLEWFISDAVGVQQVRALFPLYQDGATQERIMETLAPRVSEAFGGAPLEQATILLWMGEGGDDWGFRKWQGVTILDGGPETKGGEASDISRAAWRRWIFQRRASQATSAYQWAMERGLPVDRTPLAPPRKFRKIPIVDYAVVAQLDQRSLLVEDGPRLYRFVIGGDNGGA